mmetsp:Transcript_14538/g.26227  ORF Transcript_14538/g.26227 Transcript_14538/m.26227 type:complete len:88 (-) Transcript_14538:16-279(-)
MFPRQDLPRHKSDAINLSELHHLLIRSSEVKQILCRLASAHEVRRLRNLLTLGAEVQQMTSKGKEWQKQRIGIQLCAVDHRGAIAEP